jgi:peptidoglycan/xylan/chitin deacetylase (PgdA/CDA1 family)
MAFAKWCRFLFAVVSFAVLAGWVPSSSATWIPKPAAIAKQVASAGAALPRLSNPGHRSPDGGEPLRPQWTPVPILMYHSISVNPKNPLCVAPSLFDQEMRYLRDNHYHAISVEQLIEAWNGQATLPYRPIVITFDDGYLDAYTEAYPILKKYGLTGTLFLVPGFVGHRNFVTWDEVREMYDRGVMEIGSHTMNHLDLTRLNPSQLMDQVSLSKHVIEREIHQKISIFCYPSGRFNATVIAAVRHAGYQAAVTTRPGWASPVQGLYALHRVRVSGFEPLPAFVTSVKYY